MGWTIRIGQGGSIRTQDRVVDVRVTEEFAHKEFTVTIQNPTATDRAQAKGRVDAAIIEIKRGSDTLIEGFIEDVEKGHNTIKYSGRSFLVLLGYTTSSTTSGGGTTEAEYEDDDGDTIISDLIGSYCYPHDNELVYSDIDFTQTYMGEVKLHGKKVYDIVRNMCVDYSKDLYADATWTGDNVTAKNIHIKTRERGSSGTPHKTLYGGIHLKDIPTVKYRSSQNVVNRIRVLGKGSGKDRVSVIVDDAASQATYGVIEGAPYSNNMISRQDTATAIGQAIIDAKKTLVEELHTDLIQYMPDLRYGDWVKIIDSYSFTDTTQRIKKITQAYNNDRGESTSIEVGMPFDNYEMLIKDLTKGDVDAEPEMLRAGGSFRITANTPPEDYVRVEKGTWYDTTGTFKQKDSDSSTPAWDPVSANAWVKALIQISDSGSITAKYGTEYGVESSAKAENVAADALNTPLGELILHGSSSGNIHDIYNEPGGSHSYVYRDVRPIVGSTGGGGSGISLWEDKGTYVQLIQADHVSLRDKNITNLLTPAFSTDAANKAYVDAEIAGFVAGLWEISGNHLRPISLNTVDLRGQHLAAVGGTIEAVDHLSVKAFSGKTLSLDSPGSGGSVDIWENSNLIARFSHSVGLNMNTHKITGLVDGTAATHAATVGQSVTNPMTAMLDLAGNDIVNVNDFCGKDDDDLIFYGVNTAGTGTNEFMRWKQVGQVLQMNSKKITGLAAATANGEAVRYEQAVTNPLGANLAAGGYDITGLDVLTLLNSASYINMSDGEIVDLDYLKAHDADGIELYTHGGAARLSLGMDACALKCWNAGIDMNGNDLYTVGRLVMENGSSNIELNDGTIIECGGITMNDATSDIAMAGSKITGLADGTAADHAATVGQLGGGGLWTDASNNAWLKTAKHINMQDKNIINVDSIVMNGAGSMIYNLDGLYLLDSGSVFDMNSGNITECKNISGLTTGTDGANRLNLDFRGDANHRIYYTGSSDNRLGYKTTNAHAFQVGAAVVCEIQAGELEMNSGKNINLANNDILDVDDITMHGTASIIDVNGGKIEMGSGDLIQCKYLAGLTTGIDGANRLAIDFRGDNNHRIRYEGNADNRLGYKTYYKHAFAIQSVTVMQIASGGIELTGSLKLDGATGKIKIEENDSTGDMEFTVQSGDAFVFKTVA